MIWLTWRQHRKQALFTVLAMAALAAVLVPTGLAMRNSFTHSGLAACLAKLGTAQLIPNNTQACDNLNSQFHNEYGGLNQVGILFAILPLLVGLFFGAPLIAREVEHSTHRLVWTQGVSRLHWALAKIGLLGAAVIVLAVVYALGAGWWLAPLAATGEGRLSNASFDVQGIAPIGYTLFAVALGIVAGTVWRKMLPAMAATLAGFIGVRVAIDILARRHYLTPQTLSFDVQSQLTTNPNAGDWVYAQGVRDAAGNLVLPNDFISCPPAGTNMPNGADPLTGCLNQSGLGSGANNWLQYQPADRFWAFQAIETGTFLVLATLLLFLALRRIRRIA
ncbi:MAG TPA: transporter [Pseudonocardiaceae bacterium]|nr:transporter [Pseudonocardiaceae bacterium]